MVAFLITVIVTPVVRKYALRWKLGDKPNGRKIHTDMIPHLGGIAIVLGTVCGLAAVTAFSADAGAGWKLVFQRMSPAIGLIVALGMIDDMKNLRAIQKLSIQVVTALILAISGFLLLTGSEIFDGSWITSLLVSVVFMVGVSSSINLIDGHDGLAAGISLISAAAFAVMAAASGSTLALICSLALGGASLGFLVFNFPPGKIFMGDTGSMFLGIMLAIVACFLTTLKPSVHTFAAVCFVLGVPMLDAWLAIARRIILHSPVFKADSQHMHHVLGDFGCSAKQILLAMYSMQAFLTVLGLLVWKGFTLPIFVGVAFMVVLFVSFLRVMVASRASAPVTAKLSANSIPTLKSNLPRQNTSLGR